jgi:hypothetical protein
VPARANWTNPFTPGSCERSLGSGWVIGCDPDANGNGRVYRWNPSTGWSLPDGGVTRGKFITVDLLGNPWITNSAGQIFKFSISTGGFVAFQPQTGFCASSVAVGMDSNNEIWAIGCNLGVYHWNGAAWERINPNLGATYLAVFSQPDPLCGEHLPWAMGIPLGGSHGQAPPILQGVVQEACGSHAFADTPFTGRGLTTDFLLGTDGNLYHWNGTNLESPPYAAAPWGTLSVIANGVNGLFAARPATANGIRVFQAP